MRLLHTERLDFQEFFDSQTPKYAILSHRWTGDEVSFQDFHRCKEEQRPIFDKVQNCCSLAKKNGYEWVWIDTCCIDKKSSAELSEAINSMYAWYKKSHICYVYLADVFCSADRETTRNKFRESAWFTRGWTLQELLAPTYVQFYDRDWNFVGDHPSNGTSLSYDISVVTGISWSDLSFPTAQCIAKKFSWLSKRYTSRVEDMAYCMLGLCGVNMPLLYGEGEKAFYRLQLEIIKESDDESIFAWFCDNRGRLGSYASGLVAQSPRNFAESGYVERTHYWPKISGFPYSMTNNGLVFSFPRLTLPDSQNDDAKSLVCELSCITTSNARSSWSSPVIINLLRIGGEWHRIQFRNQQILFTSRSLRLVADRNSSETVYIPDNTIICIEDMDEDYWLTRYRPPFGWAKAEKIYKGLY